MTAVPVVDQYLTPEQAAELLQCSLTLVYRLARRTDGHALPSVRVGRLLRFRRSALDEWDGAR